MIINSYCHDLLCLVLADHIFIQLAFYNVRRRNIFHSQLLFRFFFLFQFLALRDLIHWRHLA